MRREFEYRRHGPAALFAALNVHHGTVAGWVTDSTRADNFVAFLTDLVAQTPTAMQLHCIVDNLSAHCTPAIEAFLDDHPHVFLHAPHPRFLAQPGRAVFSIMQRRLLRHGEFDSVDHSPPHHRIINAYNRRAQPFRWTYDARPLKAAYVTLTHRVP